MPELTVRNIAFMALMAATVAAALAAVVLLVRQDDNAPIRIIAPDSQPAQDELAAQVRVYVNGAVARPGVYTLDAGSRVTDALAAAGGVTRQANTSGLNLALRLKDEAEYYIPKLGETPPAAKLPPELTQAQAGGLIDLNLASEALLDTLPGIGPALARAIISYRENVGPFRSVAEIQEVPKIGPVTYRNLRDLVTVSGTR